MGVPSLFLACILSFKRGCVDVVCTVYGFVKKQLGTGITLEKGECRLPPLQYATRAFWLDVGVTAKRAVDDARRDFEARYKRRI